MQTTKNKKENNEESQEKANKETIFVKSNGTNYIYQKTNTNTNKTIICIHGIGGHTELFADFASYFLNLEFEQYNVLRYDLIGRGHSDYPSDNKFDAESHLKQLRDLIVHLELHQNSSKYIILGHSMGGSLATLYTNKYPDEVAALILLAPAGLLERSFALKLLDYCPSWLVKTPLRYIQQAGWRLNFVDPWSPIANKIVSDLYELHAEVPTIFDASYECLFQFPLTNLEEAVVISLVTNPTLPILLMWGKKDEIVLCDPNFMKWAKLLEEKEKLLACTLYDELGHDFFIEDPKNVFQDIKIFLQHFL
jgi:pimeloyl-ACP methyl ester carboxylesterase